MPSVRMESSVYWIVFIAAFLLIAVWESARPLRPLSSEAGRRWGRHAIVFGASAVFAGLALRVSPVFVALAIQDSPYGLLNRGVVPSWIRFVIALLALDFLEYAIHRTFHSVHFLWRVHAVHHSDFDCDVSTAVRFHPVEVLIEQAVYLGAIALLAPPPAAVFTSEVLIVAENLFVHANKSLPPAFERILGRIFITPDFHRIHHSEEFTEQNRNFGVLFPWWDRIFGSYVSAPARGSQEIVTGLKELKGADTLSISCLFAAPFKSPQLPVPQAQHGSGDESIHDNMSRDSLS